MDHHRPSHLRKRMPSFKGSEEISGSSHQKGGSKDGLYRVPPPEGGLGEDGVPLGLLQGIDQLVHTPSGSYRPEPPQHDLDMTEDQMTRSWIVYNELSMGNPRYMP